MIVTAPIAMGPRAGRRPSLERASRLVVTCLLGSFLGCGPSRAPTIATSGEILFRGEPLAGADVLFCPSGGRPAVGVTNAHGRFTLRTWTEADGAIEGEHVVCVTKHVLAAAAGTDDPYAKTKNLAPARYASPVDSPLRATVTRAGPNVFRFDLEP